MYDKHKPRREGGDRKFSEMGELLGPQNLKMVELLGPEFFKKTSLSKFSAPQPILSFRSLLYIVFDYK